MTCETLRVSTSEQFWQFVPKDRKSSKILFSYDVEIEHLIAIDDSGPQCRGKSIYAGFLARLTAEQSELAIERSSLRIRGPGRMK